MFDDLIALEDNIISQGKQEGVKDGRYLGEKEGSNLGFAKGFELGSEIGFFFGCFLFWDEMILEEKSCLSSRVKKSITTFGKLLKEVSFENTPDKDFVGKLEQLRAKFKVIINLLDIESIIYDSRNEHNESLSF